MKLVPVEDALVLLNLVPKTCWNHVPVVKSLKEVRISVDVVISNTISNDETSKVVSVIPLVHVLNKIPLVDLPGKVRGVYPSIALSCNIELIASETWIGMIEVLKTHKCILGLRHVAVQQVISSVSNGESYSCRAFNIQKVSVNIPWVRVRLNDSFTIIENEGPMLRHKSQHRGTAGTTVEPNKDWISRWLIKRFYEDIVKALG